jgi:hypothetical protein
LPDTTAALRFKPRSFARFIGEPLNAAEKLRLRHQEQLPRKCARFPLREYLARLER